MKAGACMSKKLHEAFDALEKDLIDKDGPRISTMRNYRFAIVPYEPVEEFELRARVQTLTSRLVANSWVVLPISLQQLVLTRVRAQGSDWMQRVIAMERRLDRERALKYLRDRLMPIIEGDNGVGGIADDCAKEIRDFVAANPDKAERTLALVGRAGSLYPFFRSSALLKHLDGKTSHIPVVLLYPGKRRTEVSNGALSFMGEIAPDADYRPRIYP
jgi:hypothetical protein